MSPLTTAKEGPFTMAADHDTPSLQLKHINLGALTERLEDHADGIENLAARPMADDMRLAAQVINRLVEEIGTTASAINHTIARLLEQATGQ
jgi:hypothetical protein